MTHFGERHLCTFDQTHSIRLKGQPSLKDGANNGRIFRLLMSNIVSGYKWWHNITILDMFCIWSWWTCLPFRLWAKQPSPICYLPPRVFYASRNHCRVPSIFTFAVIVMICTIHPGNFWRVSENLSWRFKFVPHKRKSGSGDVLLEKLGCQ